MISWYMYCTVYILCILENISVISDGHNIPDILFIAHNHNLKLLICKKMHTFPAPFFPT